MRRAAGKARRTCQLCGKLIFTSQKAAMRSLRSMKGYRTAAKAHLGYVPCRAYLAECGFWHLTHVPRAQYDKGRSGAA